MKRKFLFLLVLIIIISCKSADRFIIKNFDDFEKSKILTDKGIAIYENDIEKKQEYTEGTINIVKEYFLYALYLDKSNERAKEYIKKMDSLKQYFFNKMMKSVFLYKNKNKRQDRDEYYLCYYLEKALEIDPANSEALKLRSELKTLREKLVDSYTSEGDKIKEMINKTKSEDDKIKLYVSGYDIYKYIKLIDNTNNNAIKELEYYSNQLEKVTVQKLKENEAKLRAGKFNEVYTALKVIVNYNDRSYGKHTREITDIKYRLFYFWGLDLYRKGEFLNSLYKINEALVIKKDRNLLNIKRNITEEKLNTENIKNSYESVMAEIDDHIDKENLVMAKIKIDSLLKMVKANEQKIELKEISKTVIEKSKELYDTAVKDYNDENFSEAIRKFQIVIKVISDYKDVKSYLDKSVEKQKVIEMH